MNPDQKYFVKVAYEWGKVGQPAESTGEMAWNELSYEQSVTAQNAIVIPGVKLMLDEAGILGMETAEMSGKDVSILKNKQPGKK